MRVITDLVKADYLWQHFMPVIRNINPSRPSVICDGAGWPKPESIQYTPNGQPLNGSIPQRPASSPFFPGSLPIYSDRQYCIPSDGLPYHPSAINISRSHARPREPGHIPRPRNAFIVFRSCYIATTSEGQQNELSRQAGKVWNKMTEDERQPFIDLAIAEKKIHQAMYPSYVYRPDRGSARRKGIASEKGAGNASEPMPSSAPSVFSKSTIPEIPSAAPTLRPLRAAAQLAVQKCLLSHSVSSSLPPAPPPPEDFPMQESWKVECAEPKLSAKMDVVEATVGIRVLEELVEKDDFVPTADIPELELSPTMKEEPEHAFDLSMRPSHLDRIPEQFGFKYHNDSIAMFAHLPPTLNLDDKAFTGDMPSSCLQTPSPATTSISDDILECLMSDSMPGFWHSLPTYMKVPDFPSCSRTSSPATTSISDDISEVSMADNIPGSWQPPTTHLKAPHQPAPDFPSYSRTPSPAIFPTHMSRCTSALLSTHDNVLNGCQQQPTNNLAVLRQSIPCFTRSYCHETDSLSSENTVLDGDLPFMSSLFDFDSLQ